MPEEHATQRRRLRPRRVIAPAMAFLLLGAVLNVAVAWALLLSVLVHNDSPPPVRQGVTALVRDEDGYVSEWWHVSVRVVRGCSAVRSLRQRASGQGVSGRRSIASYTRRPDSAAVLPYWAMVLNNPSDAFLSGESDEDNRSCIACGWPIRTLCCVVDVDADSKAFVVRGALRGQLLGDDAPLILPLLPIWPGFAINTIFYGALLWLVFFAPGTARRAIRRRRGLCPACAYPRGESHICTSAARRCRGRHRLGVRRGRHRVPAPDADASDTVREC